MTFQRVSFSMFLKWAPPLVHGQAAAVQDFAALTCPPHLRRRRSFPRAKYSPGVLTPYLEKSHFIGIFHGSLTCPFLATAQT